MNAIAKTNSIGYPPSEVMMHAVADGLQNAWMLDPTIDMAAEIEQLLVLLRPQTRS